MVPILYVSGLLSEEKHRMAVLLPRGPPLPAHEDRTTALTSDDWRCTERGSDGETRPPVTDACQGYEPGGRGTAGGQSRTTGEGEWQLRR